MKKYFKRLIFILLIFYLIPTILSISTGAGINPTITTEEFAPNVWMCDSRIITDDNTEPGRVSGSGEEIIERINNYAFEGEKINWTVLVMDKNGINKIQDVFATVGNTQGAGNDIEVNCVPDLNHTFEINYDITCSVGILNLNVPEFVAPTRVINCSINNVSNAINYDPALLPLNGVIPINGNLISYVSNNTNFGFSTNINGDFGSCNVFVQDINSSGSCSVRITNVIQSSLNSILDPSCNARILEENITRFNPAIMKYYDCTFTVETTESIYGEYWVTVEALDLSGKSGTMDENEFWFFNPVIALSIDGEINFENVRPGSSSYSSTFLVGNYADSGSGVLMDMFISGTDFYDSSSSGAMCPTTNQLALDNFRYFATRGSYSTLLDPRRDAEGYVPIKYGIGFNNPNPFYDNNEIIQSAVTGSYSAGNILTPGAEIAITFRLDMPEPCNGNFDSGEIYFWSEAI